MGIFDASSLPSGPTSQGTTNSSVASWAQPYINQYLTGAQNLVNQGAQPNALMQQSYTGAANLQTPGQFAQGSNLLNQAGQGQLGTVGTALGYGQQAAGAGANYAAQATNPSAVAAYMNPYVQQALAPQLQLLNQQQALQGQDIAAKAVGQGAFGGNRATLAQGLNAQNFDLARQNAIAQGYNTAFQNAQQAQQFGANLGLQGLATGLQGVGAAQQGYTGAQQAGIGLGNLGYQQNQADVARLGLQNQLGLQQYQLPYQNLQFMQSMMAGLPYSNQTQQGWQAPPNALSQITGLAGAGITGLALARQLGAFSDLKNPFTSSPYAAANQTMSDVNTGKIAADAGGTTYNALPGQNTDLSAMNEDYGASGGLPKDFKKGKTYASGGLATLAMHNATKGCL